MQNIFTEKIIYILFSHSKMIIMQVSEFFSHKTEY